MIQYRPWEKEMVKPIIEQSNKRLSILDIQLGGACNLKCIYCDTPKYGYPCLLDLDVIDKLAIDGDIKWIYICGLGEPTEKANLIYLKQILQICKMRKINISMFSNILNLDQELLEYIDQGILYILFKLDTFDKNKIAYLYRKDVSQVILSNYQLLNEVIHLKDGITNIGASIVPTSVNYDELPEVINYCMERGIFPLIGQLENAGVCQKTYDNLKVSEEELQTIQDYFYHTYGEKYEIPICPATISGIHITNTNNIIIDERTGLSCPWFWLDEPQLHVIGNIQSMTYNQIIEKIIKYRKTKIKDVESMLLNTEEYALGGCGGNVKKLLSSYMNIVKK